MNIFNAAECFLPELELDSDVELLEAGIEMSLQSVRVAEVDSMHLLLILGGIGNMVPQKLTEPSEFCFPYILLAEREGL